MKVVLLLTPADIVVLVLMTLTIIGLGLIFFSNWIETRKREREEAKKKHKDRRSSN
jgi:hypothetical protein